MNAKNGVFYVPLNRRRFLKSMAVASAGFTLPGYLAEALTLTPTLEQGPYYPLEHNIPLDKDNDLLYMNDGLTPATGIITHVSGRVLDNNGNPIRGALVELWQADANGKYVYSVTRPRSLSADPNFQGFGQFLTGSNGAYRFRTIKAGLYYGRARHLHWGITIPGQLTRFTTQTYWDEPQPPDPAGGGLWPWYTCGCYCPNCTNDSLLASVGDPAQRASVMLNFTPVPGSVTGEQQASWDIVMGLTPMYPAYPDGGSLLIAGSPVAGPTNSVRFKLTIPAYTNYTYEVYCNPTLADLSWGAMPFSLSQSGTINTNKFTATSNGPLHLYLDEKAFKGFYYVSFRVPGANTGTP